MKVSEHVQHLWKTRGKFSFTIRELLEIFNTYGTAEEKLNRGDIRRILRQANVADHALNGRGRRDVWIHPAVIHAAKQWEAQQ